ncbi:unnamed protein product [Protopolystoma xenopodis]|uniref:Uncharacterized protein n=1 Tax=Protopolystoma xenopodis TaxID=117903 RepID=A0A3S5AWZ9_9PLAT|nr:unnamed protein product [Protopolystoma xenopodis]
MSKGLVIELLILDESIIQLFSLIADAYAKFWPLIGIGIEILTLMLIIYLYERRQRELKAKLAAEEAAAGVTDNMGFYYGRSGMGRVGSYVPGMDV